MKKWISGLAIASLSMPAVALGAPDSDVQRALKASRITDQHHAQCLEARDYEGCMRVKSSGSAAAPVVDFCASNGLCKVKARGNDAFGLPKPFGWWYFLSEEDDRIFYYKGPYRIPHKGQSARYLGYKRITRGYVNPKAGTAGTFLGRSDRFTNCTGYNSNINCTTTGGESLYLPGQGATPGGIKSLRWNSVYDCKDNTYATYTGSEIGFGGWRKNSDSSWARQLKKTCSKSITKIMKLDTMKVQM